MHDITFAATPETIKLMMITEESHFSKIMALASFILKIAQGYADITDQQRNHYQESYCIKINYNEVVPL